MERPKAVARKKSSSVPKKNAHKQKRTVRSYSTTTIKTLFALSGNQCAFPQCPNGIVLAGTKFSNAAVVGHICHIYAASDNGPRGKPDLTEQERNSASNLILMCGHHHPTVDKQFETYPAVLLLKWKQAHEARFTSGTAEALQRMASSEKLAFFVSASDDEIQRRLARLRRARHLGGFNGVTEAEVLAEQVEQLRYSGGSAEVRARALAWCGRILAHTRTERAKDLVRESEALEPTTELEIAKAFIDAESDMTSALRRLSKLSAPEARSAALRIVVRSEGAKKALVWIKESGLSATSFDPEGKFDFLWNALIERQWDTADAVAKDLRNEDFDECPVLLHGAALVHLTAAVPKEFRHVVIVHPPLESDTFPLASTPESLTRRRTAQGLFERVSGFARTVGADQAADNASDFALWLKLRDPMGFPAAIAELRDSMEDAATSLRRLSMAVQFGLKVDIANIEERIDQRVALSGGGSSEEATARFALALTKSTPKEIVEYIEKHRALFNEHLNRDVIVALEVQALAKAGRLDTARELLEQASQEGLIVSGRAQLERVLAEAAGSDAVTVRRAAYEETGDLQSLVGLIEALEDSNLWQELLPFVKRFFEDTASSETLQRLIRCLEALGNYEEILAVLSAHQDMLEQSRYLKVVWAWTLYREGRFREAESALRDLPNKDDENARRLRVNIAIASGRWDQLLSFCQETWEQRDRHSAIELIQTAQLSAMVGGLHSRDLAIAATQKEPDNPQILVNAYSQAVAAGWEQSPQVAQWIERAAQLSGEDGPIQTFSIRELLEKQPEWHKQSDNVWQHLKEAKVPAFLAGKALRRTLLDLYLTPSLTNPHESDARRRNIVLAYSGARPSDLHASTPKTLAVDLTALLTFARLGVLDAVLTRFQIQVPHSTLGLLFEERQRATFHQPSRIKDAAEVRQLASAEALTISRLPRSNDQTLIRHVGDDLAAMLSLAKDKTIAGVRSLVVRPYPLYRVGSPLEELADVSNYESYLCSCAAVVDALKRKGVLTMQEEEKARNYLKLHEHRWPNEPEIGDGTELYLDDLSVVYLQTTGVLAKLKPAGIRAYLAQSEDRERSALLAAERLGEQQLRYIEAVRRTLADALISGSVKAGRAKFDKENDLLRQHPTYGVLELVPFVDGVVVDDRYVNQHLTMSHESATKPVFSSLDVLSLMCVAEIFSKPDLFAHRIVLRQFGYQLILPTDDEIYFHVMNAGIERGELVESAELRAIRESLARARMSGLPQLPGEAGFLDATVRAHIRTLKRVWAEQSVGDQTRARANYLLEQTDIRKWAAAAAPGNERAFALDAFASYALQLVTPPMGLNEESKSAYFEWVTAEFLEFVSQYQPEVFEWLLNRVREIVVRNAAQAAELYKRDSQ